METVRAFIAVDIGNDIRAKLDELQRKLNKVHANVRWTKPRTMHLTLAFLGNVSTDQIDNIKSAMNQSGAGLAPIQLKAFGTGFFGSPKDPRVIWAGITESPELDELQRRIIQNLHDAQVKFDSKPFSPHLTLGRVKGIDRHIPPLLEKLDRFRETELGSHTVDHVELIQSTLNPHGAEYRVLHRARLI